jgi:hypothetical protein
VNESRKPTDDFQVDVQNHSTKNQTEKNPMNKSYDEAVLPTSERRSVEQSRREGVTDEMSGASKARRQSSEESKTSAPKPIGGERKEAGIIQKTGRPQQEARKTGIGELRSSTKGDLKTSKVVDKTIDPGSARHGDITGSNRRREKDVEEYKRQKMEYFRREKAKARAAEGSLVPDDVDKAMRIAAKARAKSVDIEQKEKERVSGKDRTGEIEKTRATDGKTKSQDESKRKDGIAREKMSKSVYSAQEVRSLPAEKRHFVGNLEASSNREAEVNRTPRSKSKALPDLPRQSNRAYG